MFHRARSASGDAGKVFGRPMKKALGVLMMVGMMLSACAPMQATKPLVYQNDSSVILATAAELCPTLQPIPDDTHFSLESISGTAVVCEAEPVASAVQRSPVVMTITTIQDGSAVSVTVSEDLGNPTATDFTARDEMVQELNARFQSLP